MFIVGITFFNFIGSLLIGYWGRNYRFRFWGYFFASLLFTTPIGILLVIASNPNKSYVKCHKNERI